MAALLPRVIWELTPTVQGSLIRGSNSYGGRGCLRARPFSVGPFFRANTKNKLISLAPVRSIYTARSSEFTLRDARNNARFASCHIMTAISISVNQCFR